MKYFLFLVTTIFGVGCHILRNHKEDETTIPTEIISNYLHRYFSREQVFLSIVLSFSSEEQQYFQEDVISNLLVHSKLSNFSFNVLSEIDQSNEGNRRTFNLILIENISSLKKALNYSTVQTFHVYQNFLIFLTESGVDLNEVFATVMELGLLKVNVLIKDSNMMNWSLHSYKPFAKDCHSFELQNIAQYSAENYTNELNISYESMFPSRRIKFPNCPLYISTFPISPFVIVNKFNETVIGGIDVIIAKEISETMNLVPIFLLRKRGQVSVNGTSTGALKTVLDGEANMTIGSYTPALERLKIMAHTKSYMRHSLVFAYLRSSEHSSALWRLMQPFQEGIWISIGILLTFSALVILLTKELPARRRHFIIGGRVNRTPLLNMLAVVIGNVIPNTRMLQWKYFGVFARTIFLLWSIFWLVVRSSYEGSLYEFLQSQRVKSPYDTVAKVRNADVRIYIISTVVRLIPETYARKRFIEHQYDPFTALGNVHSGKWSGVAFLNDMTINYYNDINKSWRSIGYTKDIVRPLTPVFYFRKNTILTWMFDRKIEMCTESGLTQHWISKFKHAHKRDKHRQPRKLSIESILGIMQISTVMCVVSLIVFAVEVISHKIRVIRKFLNYLTY